MMTSRWFVLIGCIWLLIGSGAAYAQDDSTPAWANFQYPELQVTPLASERLRMEASRSSNRIGDFVPLWVASGLTTAAAFSVSSVGKGSDANRNQSMRRVGLLVGAGWLAAGSYIAFSVPPYHKRSAAIQNFPTNTQRQQLFKERLAEEELKRAARLGSIIRWSSAISLFASNAMILASMPDEARKDENGRKHDSVNRTEVIAGLGMAAAVASLFFQYSWESTWSNHESYKRKIYAPVSQVVPTERGGAELLFTWLF